MADEPDLAEKTRHAISHEHTLGAKFNLELILQPKNPPKPKATRKKARAKAEKE